MQIYANGIQFKRLLLGKTDQQIFDICNVGLVPFEWDLNCGDTLPPEMSVYPKSGELGAKNNVQITVELNGIEETKMINNTLTLEVWPSCKTGAQTALQRFYSTRANCVI